MKILVLSFYFYPDLCAGSFRSTALVRKLAKRLNLDAGDSIEVITTEPNRYASYMTGVSESPSFEGASIYRIKIPSHKSGIIDQAKSFSYFYSEVMDVVRDREYDLIVATSSRLFTAFLASRIALKLRCKLYLDIRDIFVDTVTSVFPKGIVLFVYPFLKLIEKSTFNKADKINVVSKGFEEYFSPWKDKEITFHTNGIDQEFIKFNEISCAKANREKVNIVYAGNIGQGQGLEKIIPRLALSLGSNYVITIIGDGGRRIALEQEIKSIGCENVTMLPPCSRAELLSYYSKADILFLHLNKCSAFEKVLPSKIFEYAATGKPIVAGVSGYSRKFISEEVTGSFLFSPCNLEQALFAVESVKCFSFQRKAFNKKYTRENIMLEMSKDIINLVDNSQNESAIG